MFLADRSSIRCTAINSRDAYTEDAMATATETYFSLSQAAKLIPPTKGDRPVSPVTITKWITRGVRCGNGAVVRLESRRFPGGWKVTREAIEHFVDELTRIALAAEGAPMPTSARRARQLAHAEAEWAAICGKT
jgi:hypothetical protein